MAGDRIWTGLVIGLSFAYLRLYPDSLSMGDESILLLGAKRWLQGQAMYRDFFEFLTPGSFAAYAWAFRIGGLTATTAKVVAAAVNALSAGLAYALARKVAGRPEAILVAMLFVVGCVPAWNVASAHWISTTAGLAAATILLADRLRNRPALRSLLAGLAGGAAISNQQQRGAFLALWLALATLLLLAEERRSLARPPRWVANLCWLALGGVLPILGSLGWVVWRGASLLEVRASVIDFVFLGYGATIPGMVTWGKTIAGGGGPHEMRALVWLPLAIPVSIALESIALAVRRTRGPWDRDATVRACLTLLAGTAALSIWYFPDFVHVAFIGVFALVVAAGLVARARLSLERRWPKATRLVTVIAFAGFAVANVERGRQRLAEAGVATPLVVETHFGAVAMNWGVQRLYERLEQTFAAAPGTRRVLFSYPAEGGWNLLTDADNPTPFAFFVRGYNSLAQEQQLVKALRQQPDGMVLTTLAEDPASLVWTLLRTDYREQEPPMWRYKLFSRAGGPGEDPAATR